MSAGGGEGVTSWESAMADNVVEDAGDGIDPFPFLNFAAAKPRYIASWPSLPCPFCRW